ncbi:MAG: family 10 glycosylhydrolase [Chthonomonas sp.]|nr:family 10 glycosylhydrolase [Chthonomonas sp.]
MATAVAQTEFGPSLDSLLNPPLPRREMRAAWVATVWNIDWPTTATAAQATQRTQADTILNHAQTLKMNAVFLQVRSAADAMYVSGIEPWSKWLTNTMGTAPNPVWDPLSYWLAGARSRGIQLYVWLNPYRALPTGVTAASSHISVTRPDLMALFSGDKFFDPGKVDSRTRIRTVISDLVTRYDIDGVVFDDYFYPYPEAGETFPDSATYSAYQAAGGTLSLANWRRNNVDTLVQEVGVDIKAIKPGVKFGIGPFGIWKPGNPSGVTGLSAYDDIYADSRKWLQLGWVDFLAPQLYWKISSTGQPYSALLNWWTQQNLMSRHVYASNAAYKVADGTTSAWVTQEILDQIDVTRNTAGATGNVFYNFKVFRDNRDNLRTNLAAGQYAQPAIIPSAPWIDNLAPFTPALTYTYNRTTKTHQASWVAQGSEAAQWYVIAACENNAWSHQVVPSTTLTWSRALKLNNRALQAFAVCAVDRQGNASSYVGKVFDASVVTSGFGVENAVAHPNGAVIQP